MVALAVIAIGLILLAQMLPSDSIRGMDGRPGSSVAPRVPQAPPPKAADPLQPDIASDPMNETPVDNPDPRPGAAHDDESPAASTGMDVVVQAISPDGVPQAGVTVLFLSTYVEMTSATWPTATSDARGLARISIPQSEQVTRVKACPVVHGLAITTVAIKLPQAAPARVVVPPTGSLELELIGPDGRLWTWPTGLESRDTSFRIPTARGGRLLLPHVALGRRFRFTGDDAQAFGVRTTSVCGPTASGETVRRRLTVVCHRPHLTGRVLDPEGRPIAGGFLGFQRVVRNGGKRFRGAIHLVRATEGGRFLLALRDGRDYRTLRVRWRSGGETRAVTELPLHGHYSKTLHHLDDIRLEPAVRLARGSVRTASGAPFRSRVWVELHNGTERDLDRHERRLQGCAALGWSLDDPFDEPAGLYHASVDPDGRFEIRGAPLSRPFTLRARGGGYSETDRPNILPGTDDVAFVLSRSGTILGRIRVSPRVRADDLRVSAFTLAGRLLRSTFVANDGMFILFRMPAGRVNVAVFEPGADRPLVTIRDVRVPAGGHADDERLACIDLRQAVNLMVLRVVDPSGRPIRGATTFGPHGRHDGQKTDANGEVRFLASEAPLPCAVRARGFRPCRIKLEASRTLALKPGIPVRLLLDFGMPMPPDLVGEVYLNHERAHSPGSGTGNPAPIRKDIRLAAPTVDAFAEASGKHEVSVFFEPEEVCAHVGDVRIVIRDRTEPQRFHIRFDPENVRKAIERCARR
jgi:hypothetical protein